MGTSYSSISGYQTDGTRRRLSKLPRLSWTAVRLVWRASPMSFALTAALQLLAGAGVAAQLVIFNRLLSTILRRDAGSPDLGEAAPLLAGLVAVVAALSFAQAVSGGQRRLMAERAVRHVNELILDVAASVDLESYDRPEFFDRLQRARQNAIQMPLQVASALLDITGAVIAVAGVGVVLVALHPLLLPIVLLGYAPLYVVTMRNSRAMYSFSFGNAPYDRARFYLGQVLTGKDEAKEVRAFGLQQFLGARWAKLYDERIADIARIVRDHIKRSVVASLAGALLTAGSLLVLVWMFLSGRLDVAGAATAGVAMAQLGSRLSGVAVGGAGALYEGALFLDDFIAFVDLETRRRDPVQHGQVIRRFEAIIADGVRFAYPGTDVEALRGVDLRIGAGEIVALVGENGSGKTTLAKLLCQLYRPTVGRILWDDTDTATLDPERLRPSIAVIFQDFIKYRLTAWENIGVGDPHRAGDRAAVRRAAGDAAAHTFLESLPLGYDTILSKEFEQGTDLSVGQWQRVALARAFFRDAPFIVLDEPTAALDPRAEYELFRSIRTLCAGRAVLLISHRFSSVRAADRIYVLKDGQIVEHGTHAELMAAPALYAELFTLQASAYLGEDPAPATS